jgi:N-acetylglucosamine transport system permease protein
MRHGRKFFIISFLAVPLALYGVFVVAAYVQTFQLAFTTFNGYGSPKFAGLDNFVRLWDDPLIWKSLKNHAILLIGLPLVTISIALVFAFLLNVAGKAKNGATRGVRGSAFYKVVFFFPQLLALALIAVIFQRVYSPDDSGLINGLLPEGWDPIFFLSDRSLAIWSLLAVLIWQAIGFYVVLFSAGMGNIPQEIYEAAALDGANRIVLFSRITVPLLWSTVQVGWVYLGIAAFDAFALVNIMSVEQGGPDGATTVLGMNIYLNVFRYSNFGYASAIGVVLFFLTLTFAALTLRVTRREEVQM